MLWLWSPQLVEVHNTLRFLVPPKALKQVIPCQFLRSLPPGDSGGREPPRLFTGNHQVGLAGLDVGYSPSALEISMVSSCLWEAGGRHIVQGV